MADGAISPAIPWVHKEGLSLLNATYSSQDEAAVKIPEQLVAFYRASDPGAVGNPARLAELQGTTGTVGFVGVGFEVLQ